MEYKRLCKIIIGVVALGIKFGESPDPAGNGQLPNAGHVPGADGRVPGSGNLPPGGNTPDASGRLPGQQCNRAAGAGGDSGNSLQGGNSPVVIKSGCNFYEREDLPVQPFSKIKKGDEMCEVVLKENTDTFLYACDGTSEPATCPDEVKVEDEVVNIKTLFTGATVSNKSADYTGNPKVFHVITGKAQKTFTATCVCTKADGNKETMKLTSSFKSAGIMGVLAFMLFLVMK